MKRIVIFAICLITIISVLSVGSASPAPSYETGEGYVNPHPVAFTRNLGQWRDSILFRAGGSGAVLWFSETGVYYQFFHREPVMEQIEDENRRLPRRSEIRGYNAEPAGYKTVFIRASFVGANPDAEIVAEGLQNCRYNFFIGSDKAKWRTNVPNYSSIVMRNIYPGIDVRYSGGDDGRIMCEFTAAPGADMSVIKMDYEGSAEISTDAAGKCFIRAVSGQVLGVIEPSADQGGLNPPRYNASLSNANNDRREAQRDHEITSASVQLVYSSYIGGADYDLSASIAVGDLGNAFMTGYTASMGFPSRDPFKSFQATTDIFVTKLSADGSAAVYSTFIGGDGDDDGHAIVLDENEYAYVSGITNSTDFPTVNPFQDHFQGGFFDACVMKISPEGDSLIYATYLGGGDDEHAGDIDIDDAGSAYVCGFTFSSDFPTQNPFQTFGETGGITNFFVTKLSPPGNSLEYSTYLGGSNFDEGGAIAVNSAGNAYLAGRTESTDFPLQNPYQNTNHLGFYDLFVTELSADGSSLAFSTFLGGSGDDGAYGIALDAEDNIYITGGTKSLDFPIVDAFQSALNAPGYDAFVVKLSNDGSELIYGTFIGGPGAEWGNDIAIDAHGNVYVLGGTNWRDFPTRNPLYDYQGSRDVFLTKFTGSGKGLIFSTYLGGSGEENGWGLAVDGSGNAYVTGYTLSPDFPIFNAFQTFQGIQDGFIAKFSAAPAFFCGDANDDGTIDISDVVCLVNYLFHSGSAPYHADAGDANCDGDIDIGDAIYIVNYIFKSGSEPCCR